MSGKAIDRQRQHADIHQRDGQAAECLGDGFAAQAVARLGDQQHRQHIAKAAAKPKPRLWPRVKDWVRSTSTVPSTPLFSAASGTMRSSWARRGRLRSSHSTRCSARHTTAMLAIYTSGRSWARLSSGAMNRPARKATGATSTCVMHSIMPNKALLVRSSPTSCTMRDTPSARVKTAFCAKMASSA